MNGATHEYLSEFQVTLRNAQDAHQAISIFRQQEVQVPSREPFTIEIRAAGYHHSEPLLLGPLASGAKQTLTASLYQN